MKDTSGSHILYRSDGTVKIYGINRDGKLLTVVMTPSTKHGGYDFAEIKVHSKP